MPTTTQNFTLPDFTGDSGTGGTHGLVPAPSAGDGVDKFLKADGTWDTTPAIEEDPGPGVGLIEVNPAGGPVVLKNVKDGLGTQVQANTGSVQINMHFSAEGVAFVSDALGDPDEVPVSETPSESTIVKSRSDGKVDEGWIPDFIGDSGTGGSNGGVPAPAAGDASAKKVLNADGTWAALTASDVGSDPAGSAAAAQAAAIATSSADATSKANAAQAAAIAASVPSSATINDQTGTTYTLALVDANSLVRLSNAAAIALTVPANATVAFPIGTRIQVQQAGAGQVTVAGAGAAAGNVNSFGGALKSAGQYARFELIKTGTDRWSIEGNLTP